MSKYKKKIEIEDALKTMDSMLKVRKIDTRSKSADVIETVLYEFYKQREKLEKIEQIIDRVQITDLEPSKAYELICEVEYE